RLLSDFIAYDPAFPSSVSVAIGDVDGDGVAELITGTGYGTMADVRVWRYTGGLTRIAEFVAYDAAFRGGVFWAAGDLDGDGIAEIVTGAGPGGGPHVRVFDLVGTGNALRAAGSVRRSSVRIERKQIHREDRLYLEGVVDRHNVEPARVPR